MLVLAAAADPIQLAYIVTQVVIGCISYKLASVNAIETRGWARWLCAILILAPFSAIKMIVMTSWTNVPMSQMVFTYATTAFWECSNISLIFGGAKLSKKYGIHIHQ